MDLDGAVGGAQVSPAPPRTMASPWSEQENPFCSPPDPFPQDSPGIPVQAGTRGGDGDKDSVGNSGPPKRMGVRVRVRGAPRQCTGVN